MFKKLFVVLTCILLFTGCSKTNTYEIVVPKNNDILLQKCGLTDKHCRTDEDFITMNLKNIEKENHGQVLPCYNDSGEFIILYIQPSAKINTYLTQEEIAKQSNNRVFNWGDTIKATGKCYDSTADLKFYELLENQSKIKKINNQPIKVIIADSIQVEKD